jgi:hypothetical protein
LPKLTKMNCETNLSKIVISIIFKNDNYFQK